MTKSGLLQLPIPQPLLAVYNQAEKQSPIRFSYLDVNRWLKRIWSEKAIAIGPNVAPMGSVTVEGFEFVECGLVN